jgi:transcriptional regulator with XRE-family HTH domain
MGLKEIRLRLGLKQEDVAQLMKTTQQTIARWESGKTPIPSAHLKDLASALGIRIEELLGVKLDRKKTKDESFASVEHEMPFGTLRAALRFGVRDYPIDYTQKRAVIRDLNESHDWVSFSALDNRLVLINPRCIRSIDMITDDHEGMPFFASPQAYKNLTDEVKDAEIGPHIREEMKDVIRVLAGDRPPEEVRKIISEATMSTRVIWHDGSSSTWGMVSDEDASFIELIASGGLSGFRDIYYEEDGEMRGLINLEEVAVIEAPLQRYLDLLDEIDEAEETDK